MSNKALMVGATAALALLAGCDSGAYPEEEQAYVDEQAGDATGKQLAADQVDLKATLTELQSKDPSVREVYYSVNEKGEKVLNVVREEADGTSSNSVWPMLAGAGLGALGGYALAKSINQSGGYQQYQRQHTPQYQERCDYRNQRSDRRPCRTGGGSSAAYTTMLMNQNRQVVRSNPQFSQNLNNRVSQWRASPNTAPATVQKAHQARINGAMHGGGGGAGGKGGGT